MKKTLKKVLAVILVLTMLIPMYSFSMTANAATTLIWPVPGHTTLSGGYGGGHAGIDINDGSVNGATVVAAIGGTVVNIYLCGSQHHGSMGDCGGFGTGIIIRGDDGRWYQYAHMQANSIPSNVYRGAYVSAGQKVGCVGTTGNSSGPHLHFQINTIDAWNGSVNPQNETYNYSGNATQTPANLGDDFYGVILNKDIWKTISCDDDGFVRIRKESGKANQYWRFQRQSDGSYVISSAANGKALEMHNGDTTQGNQVAVASQYWGGNYQKWNIYEQNGGYVIASKHYPEKNLVLDMYNGDTADGTNIITWQRKNSSNQIWAIYTGSESQLSSPFLFIDEIQPGKISFNWTEVYGESQYNLRVYKDSISSANLHYSRSGVKGGLTLTFSSPGKYIAVVDAVNYYQTKSSNNVTFTVNCNTITYNANGGSGAPSSQTKITGQSIALSSTKPTRSGYTFKCWNTKADGTGTNYYPGGTYSANANVTLYAQWTVNKKNFKVTYNGNGGSSIIPYTYVEEGSSLTLTTPLKNFTISYNANGGSNAPSATNVSVDCLGWALSSTATKAAYACGASYKPTSDVTLYAVWEKAGETSLSSEKPVRNGYTFLGWSEDPNATKADFSPNEPVTVSGNATLYAVWGTEEPVKTGYAWWEWIIIIVFFGWIWYV